MAEQTLEQSVAEILVLSKETDATLQQYLQQTSENINRLEVLFHTR